MIQIAVQAGVQECAAPASKNQEAGEADDADDKGEEDEVVVYDAGRSCGVV